EFGVTPVQYAALSAVLRQPGVDQRTLARMIGFDTSTIGSVIDRLEARGLMVRNTSPADRRVRLLSVTAEGAALLAAAEPSVLRAQQRMLEPLPQEQRGLFMDMMAVLVRQNDELARAPSRSRLRRPRPMDWDHLRFFGELARSGSMAAAARQLGVEHTTVSRRIQALEKQLGAVLFEREAGQWRPTEAGRQLLGVADAMQRAAAGL
ncbi:LysR family transcriptional regulator, partial [Pseudomonas aeruginosa]